MSLKPLLGRLDENHEPELNVRLCNSRLGEMDPLGWDLQGFKSDYAHSSLWYCTTIPKHSTSIPKQCI